MRKGKHFVRGREDLILESNVRNIFTPHRPVQTAELFFGRQKEVQKLIEHINTPGQHCLLYGDRGVGKSSLANISSHLLKGMMKGKLYTKRCDSHDTFRSIMEDPLLDQGFDININEQQETLEQDGSAKLKIPVAEAGVSSRREVTTSAAGARYHAESPSWVAKQIYKERALLVIDEADSITALKDRSKLAELMKHLSDSDSAFKILLVGIAETGADLIGHHPSVERCLRETYIDRMTNSEIRELVEGGAKRVHVGKYVRSDFAFDPAVLRWIVDLSSGYPHFAHLLALKCAEEAISHGRSIVIEYDLQRGLESAAEDAETSLRRMYHAAVRNSASKPYRQIVGAAAVCGGHEFKVSDLCDKTLSVYKERISVPSMQNYIRALIRPQNGEAGIFKRIAKGLYSFKDPRMSSYVRMVEKWAFMKAGEL